MLGKLLKHELKETAKPLIPLNLALIAVTLIGAIMLGTKLIQNDSAGILTVSCTLLYMLVIFALFIITGVYLMIRFYKTMYSNRGYLTHTLPVSSSSILNTKILISAFWIAVAFVITVVSVMILIRIGVGNAWDSIDFSMIDAEFSSGMGMGISEFIKYMVVTLLISCFYMVLMVAASISIGQLFNQYRIVAAVVTYIIFYVIQQIIGVISIAILGIGSMDTLLAVETEIVPSQMASFYRGIFLFGIVETLLFCIIYYIICHYITNKKLNLE